MSEKAGPPLNNCKRSLGAKGRPKKSMKGITRRQSLKTLAASAYAVPATVALLTAPRAIAQSCPEPCENIHFRINNTNNWYIQIEWDLCFGGSTNNNTSASSYSDDAMCGSFVTVTYTGTSPALQCQFQVLPGIGTNEWFFPDDCP